jgi:hypothetical protein
VNDDIPIWEDTRAVEAHYANCFKIGHNAFEFVIDCGHMTGDGNSVRLTGRILTNPHSAKSLYQTLKQTLEEYEGSYGTISCERED